MMDWTRPSFCRYFLRGFSPDVLLYTEMITAVGESCAVTARGCWAFPILREHPVALQLGRERAAASSRRAGTAPARQAGYDEINLNLRLFRSEPRGERRLPAPALMLEPARVGEWRGRNCARGKLRVAGDGERCGIPAW